MANTPETIRTESAATESQPDVIKASVLEEEEKILGTKNPPIQEPASQVNHQGPSQGDAGESVQELVFSASISGLLPFQISTITW